MNEGRKRFDWQSFVVRLLVIVPVATWWFIERLKHHDRFGAFLVASIGYVIFPILAYLETRYFNLLFIGRVVKIVRQKVARRAGRDVEDI